METRLRKTRMSYAMTLSARNVPLEPPSWSSGTYARGVTSEFVTESMTSYYGPRRRGMIHPMTHFRVEARQVAFMGTRVDANQFVWRTYSGSYPFLPANTQSPWMTDIRSDEAVFELLGGIPTQVALPSLILELPQTLTLWNSIKEVFSSKLSKGVSDATLIGSFGVAPLAGDLQKLWNLSGFINKKVKELRDSAEKGSWRRFRKTIPCKGGIVPNVVASSGITVVPTTSNLRMEIIGKRKNVYGLPSSADVFAMYADALGFSRPLEVAWEATPFSFVADWFYPLGDHLKNMTSSYVRQPWIFKGVCTSVKATGSAEVRLSDKFNDVAGLGWAGGRGPTIGVITVSYHNRTVGMPSLSPNSVFGARFGLKQVGLSAALLGQRL